MFKKHLATALAALLAVAACAPCARAQSGRRFPQATADKGFVALTDEKSDAAREATASAPSADARTGRDKDFDLRNLNARRSAPVVFAEDGDKHPNKADKIAGAALLGYLIFAAIMIAKSDGYMPTGGTAPYGGLRR